MGLTASRDDIAAGTSEAYHAYGRAAARSPLQSSAKRPREANAPHSSMSSRNARERDDTGNSDDDRLVASLFTWNFGGQSVSVTGAWDGWREKTPLERNGTEYHVIMFIPSGEYQFKFYVDENWQCNPAIEQRTDENGNTNNYVKVVANKLEYDTEDPIDKPGPPSPLSSYDKSMRSEFPGEVPSLPVQIAPFVTREEKNHVPDPLRGSSYVRYDHVFTHRSDDVRTLSIMERHKKKTITTLFVTSAENVASSPLPPSVADLAAARS